MSGNLKLWTLAGCLVALSLHNVSSQGDNLGRSVTKPVLCGGEAIKLHLVDNIAKECNFKLPKGRTAGKECPAACVQQSIGLLSDKFEVINNADELAKNLVNSGLYPPHAAKISADAIIKANCNAQIEHSRECEAHLDFGDCVVGATLVACSISHEQLAGYHKNRNSL